MKKIGLLLIFILVMAINVSAANDDLTITYAGESYTITKNNSGGDGNLAWQCDSSGNVYLTFKKVGNNQLKVTSGYLNITSAKLIGGGAGGSAPSAGENSSGNSGAGGGGGEIKNVDNIENMNSKNFTKIELNIGAGGAGAIATNSSGKDFQCPTEGGYSYKKGADGGATSLTDGNKTISASGGLSDGGAISVSGDSNGINGIAATATRAAGGASGAAVSHWADYSGMAGNFNEYSMSCFLCGLEHKTNYTGADLGTYYETSRLKNGGASVDGGGAGGNPGNNHGCGGRNIASNNGGNASSYGAGGGGASYAPGTYSLWHHSHSATGSTSSYYYVGNGGNGYQGIIYLNGSIVDTSIPQDRIINSNYYSKGSSKTGETVKCGDLLYITTCDNETNAICKVSKINGTVVQEETTIYENLLVSSKSAANCEPETTKKPEEPTTEVIPGTSIITSNVEESTTITSPQTGISDNIIILILVGLLLTCSIVILERKNVFKKI